MAQYKITVLEIGLVPNTPADFFFGGLYGEGEFYLNPWTMTLLQGEGKNILIDTGVDADNPVKREICAAAGIENLQHPRDILATVGLRCEDIDAVILTHCHVDHASGLACYPNAKLYVQREDYEKWRELVKNPKYCVTYMMSLDPADLDLITAMMESGRVELLDGDVTELFPGISVKMGGFGHSFAPQIILVNTENGVYIHIGDIANRPENLVGADFYIPNLKFAVGSVCNTLRDYDRIMDWAGGDIGRVITTHDGSRRERFPGSVGPLGLGIYHIC